MSLREIISGSVIHWLFRWSGSPALRLHKGISVWERKSGEMYCGNIANKKEHSHYIILSWPFLFYTRDSDRKSLVPQRSPWLKLLEGWFWRSVVWFKVSCLQTGVYFPVPGWSETNLGCSFELKILVVHCDLTGSSIIIVRVISEPGVKFLEDLGN